MLTRFNLYDLFGIFVPGAVLCGAVYLFLVNTDLITRLDPSLSVAVVLLPAAYAVGTISHFAARAILSVKAFKLGLEQYSVKYLKQEDDTFTSSITKGLEERIEALFGVQTSKGDKEKQQGFDMCYFHAMQNRNAVYVENFNALYGMCRSMMLVTFILVILSFLYAAIECENLSRRSRVLFWIVVPVSATGSGFVFYLGMKEYARNFVKAVYRSFYASIPDNGQDTNKGNWESGA